jgi:hypothetical protein
LNTALAKHKPCAEDLKKLILMETTGRTPRAPILDKLIIRLQKRERESLKEAIDLYIKTQ